MFVRKLIKMSFGKVTQKKFGSLILCMWQYQKIQIFFGDKIICQQRNKNKQQRNKNITAETALKSHILNFT